MFEYCTYSAQWSLLDSKKKDKTFCYRASFELVPHRGEHMAVFKGKAFSHLDIYARSVVVKGFRYCGNTEDCKKYRSCCEKGRMVAERFNNLLDKNVFKIQFVEPAVTAVEQRATITCKKKFERDEAVVFEEKLKGEFTTFVDKRSKASGHRASSLIMEAFCHFSYYTSEGRFVICGLKGVLRKDTCEFTLTNPTIHSREGIFGPKDKRDAGIQDFKDNHTCNKFCHMFMSKISSEFDKASDEC